MDLNQRNTTIAMLEYFARKRFVPYGKWDQFGAERLRARSMREIGSICRFLVEVHINHLSS